MDVRVGLQRKLSTEELMLLNLWCWKRLLRVPWTSRRSNQYNPKGNKSWIFIGRTDAEAETPILGPPDAKNWLIGKDPNAGKDWGQEEKVTTEDEMVGWHHWLDVPEFAKSLGVGDGQGSLMCCSAYSWTGLSDWTGLCVCIYMPHHFKTYLFRLCWVFLAAWGLALVGASWCYSVSCCAWASPGSGFSLWSTGFRCTGFCSYSPQVLELGLNSCSTQT